MKAVDKVKELGYTVKDGCKAIDISRSWYYAVKKRNDKREDKRKDNEMDRNRLQQAIRTLFPWIL